MCVCVCVCARVVLHFYVSQSPDAHDRKEVLEVARNADCELSTVSPLLNPASFESTKAFPPSLLHSARNNSAPPDLYIGSFVL